MILLEGKTLSQKILANLKDKILKLPTPVNLDIVLVGNDPSSIKYVQLKQQKAAEVGIGGHFYHLPENTSPQELEKIIDSLNNNHETSSYFVQLPIPNIVDSPSILNKILPGKDADGLSSINLGLLFQQHVNAIAPATAVGIIKLLDEYKIKIEGQKIVIVNDSPIVGLPLLALFNGRYATVTLCHVHTQNLSEVTQQADILVSATGVKNIITAEMVKKNVVAVDVGGGDIDFDNVSKKASYITPTFGGVGPMTVASLLENTYTLAIRK